MTDVLVDGWYDGALDRALLAPLPRARPAARRTPWASTCVPAPAGAPRSRRPTTPLVTAARPVLEQLGRAIASTRYFAILTNQDGVVVDAARRRSTAATARAALITRIGVDLSERSVGTTAIGAALAELQPVWLHRGEHFFDDDQLLQLRRRAAVRPRRRAASACWT